MDANEKVSAQEVMAKSASNVYWPLAITVFVIAFGVIMYNQTGAYQQLQQKLPAKNNAHQQLDAGQQLILRIQKLTALTKKEPENSDNWYALGQAFIGAGEFTRALNAFDEVIRIEGVQADLIGAKAQAAYYLNKQTITPDVQAFIDQALALDPKESSTNILLGMHNFTHGSYEKAIEYWQLVINSKYNNVNVQALQRVLTEAKKRLSLTDSESIPSSANGMNPAGDATPKLTIQLSLSDEIIEKLSEGNDKTVFVYAIPTNGQRMPLAAVKINASDLPLTVTLTNNNAMTPQANLSSAEAVHVLAVISNSGSPGIKSGDYQGRIENVAVHTQKPIELTINSVVP